MNLSCPGHFLCTVFSLFLRGKRIVLIVPSSYPATIYFEWREKATHDTCANSDYYNVIFFSYMILGNDEFLLWYECQRFL